MNYKPAQKREKLDVDIAVIGAGSGGLSVASGAAQLGLDVVLFEADEMGGDCLNTGCVPSKALLATANTLQTIRRSSEFGIEVDEPKVDWEEVKAHINSVIEEIDFECLSIAGALDKAKAMVKAGHADLYEDGMPICSMELVAETGVWLVGKPR